MGLIVLRFHHTVPHYPHILSLVSYTNFTKISPGSTFYQSLVKASKIRDLTFILSLWKSHRNLAKKLSLIFLDHKKDEMKIFCPQIEPDNATCITNHMIWARHFSESIDLQCSYRHVFTSCYRSHQALSVKFRAKNKNGIFLSYLGSIKYYRTLRVFHLVNNKLTAALKIQDIAILFSNPPCHGKSAGHVERRCYVP